MSCRQLISRFDDFCESRIELRFLWFLLGKVVFDVTCGRILNFNGGNIEVLVAMKVSTWGFRGKRRKVDVFNVFLLVNYSLF